MNDAINAILRDLDLRGELVTALDEVKESLMDEDLASDKARTITIKLACTTDPDHKNIYVEATTTVKLPKQPRRKVAMTLPLLSYLEQVISEARATIQLHEGE